MQSPKLWGAKFGALLVGATAMALGLWLWLADKPDRGVAEIAAATVVAAPAPGHPQTLAAEVPVRVSPETPAAVPPAVDVAKDAPESEKEFRHRRLAALLDQFDGKQLAQPPWPGCSRDQILPIVVMSSIAAVMDAQGTSTVVPQGQTPDILESGRYDFAFQVGNHDYRFRRGDFPIYEEYTALALAGAKRREAAEAARIAPGATPVQDEDMPIYSDEFSEKLSQFAHGVLPLLQ